jgi:glycine/D-amino acid oxidase-like deaminating enzyme
MRLSHTSIRPTGHPIALSFDGRPIEALEGETIAAALSAAGITTFRHTPSGAPRGLHCGMGACWDCVVTVNGRIGQRACMTQAAANLVVESGFPADLAPFPAPEPAEDRICDILVVGGGVAGLSAATAAAESGASVVLLDERHVPGGQYAKPLAASHSDSAPDRQFALGTSLRAIAEAAGVTLEHDAMVWGAFAPNEIAALVNGQSVIYRPRRLILATGAHETPNPIPGWTLPGVMTTGGLQTLVRSQRVLPGSRVLIAGNGPLNLQLACELLAAGIKPVAVLEAARRPGALSLLNVLRMTWTAPDLIREGREMVAALKKAGVPVLWRTWLDRLEGDGQVQTAIAGGQRWDVDVVALNIGFMPETGLARALGAQHIFVDRGAVGFLATDTYADGRTSVREVFSAGDGATLGGSRVAQARGRVAGLTAAADLGFTARRDMRTEKALKRAESFQKALWKAYWVQQREIPDETIICRCEEVTAARLRQEMASGLTSVAVLKKATRAGMGRCQGRYCAVTIAAMCPRTQDADAFAAPRAPLRPVPAAPLMREAPEFVAPLLSDPIPAQVLHPLPTLPVEDRRADIVVIGGGAAGLSTAYFLARDGADVLLIDRDEAAMAASTANAGSLHVQLLSYDFTDQTPEDGGPAAHTLPLAPRSISLWKEIGAAFGEDLGIRTEGGLMLAEDEAGLEWLRRKSALENRFGIESHVLSHNELRDLAPAVSERMVGADFVPAEGYGDPLRGMMALLALTQRHGARILRGAEVRAVARDGSGWRVTTTKGAVTAGKIVNATGPWAARVGRMVGIDLPVTGTVQQVIVTEPVPALTRHLVAVAHRHLSLKQQANGSFLIGGGWFGDFDAATGRTRTLRQNIEGNLWVCERALPVVKSLSILRAWSGINPAIDRAPLLGEVPGLPGFFNVVTANGYTLGPAVGQITAAAVLHGETVDPRYRLERFG